MHKVQTKLILSTKTYLKLLFAVSLVIIVGSFYKVPSSHAAIPNWQATGTKATGTTTASVGWPTHVADDIGLLVIETSSQVATEGTSGWTQVTNSPQDATGSRLTVFWKRATSGAESNATVNVTTGNHIIAYIATFRGADPTGDPFDITAGGVLTPAGTGVTLTGITTTVANTLIIAVVSNSVDSNTAQSSGWTNSNLATPSMAEVADLSTNAGDGGGIGIATGGKAGIGATGNSTATIGSSVSGWMHLALKEPAAELPTVTTSSATGITGTSAILNSTVNPSLASTNVTYLWGTSSGTCATRPNTLVGPTGLTGSANLSGATTQATLSNLNNGTTYYYCAVATNSVGTVYGTVTSVQTLSLPYVTIQSIGNITTTTLDTINGYNNTDATMTAKGFCYAATATNADPKIGGTGVTCITSGDGAQTWTLGPIIGLTSNTQYSIQAYGTNPAGTGYMSLQTFNTDGPPTVTSPTSASITATTATLGATITNNGGIDDSAITANGVCVALTATNSNPQSGGAGVTCTAGGALVTPSGHDGGNSHDCTVMSDSTIKCWGRNTEGQLGIGNFNTPQNTPVTVSGISNATQVATGEYSTCARLSDSTVKCWGNGSHTPSAVAGITTATAVTAGGGSVSYSNSHRCVLLANNTIQCWGYNGYGQIGIGNTTTPQSTPVEVTGITTATQIAAGGNHTCARLSDSTVKCWGRNDLGQIGIGNTTTPQSTPVAVTGITTATQISAGNDSTCARLSDSTVKCWGNNSNGENGLGNTTTPQSTAVAVPGITTATQVSNGNRHACARLSDSTVKCWGYNWYGEIGNGNTTSPQLSPVTVLGVNNASNVTTSHYGGCASIASDTILKCWGYNFSSVPQVWSASFGAFTVPVISLTADSQYSFTGYATNAQGTNYSAVGNFYTNGRPVVDTPTSAQITTTTAILGGNITSDGGNTLTGAGVCYSLTATNANPQIAGTGVTCTNDGSASISASSTGSYTCVKLADSTVKCWGYNLNGQIGNGNTTTPQTSPVAVTGITTATAVSAGSAHACALLSDSTIKCWGLNSSGQTGNGNTTTPQLTPVAVSGITTATQVSAGGAHTCALLSDSTIKCWGYNVDGEVGDNSIASPKLTPVATSGITNATQVSAGYYHNCARLSDSTVKCWGYNVDGQVGNGTTTSPKKVPVVTSGITNATQVYAGTNHSCARLSDSTVKCWGYNLEGQTGNGNTTTPQSSPVVVSGITTATAIAVSAGHSCALLSDSTARCWGQNVYGQVGTGNTTSPQLSLVTPSLSSVITIGVFTKNITGLTGNSAYSFTAFATNASGTRYTSAATFSTDGPPVVTSPTSANITATTADLGGNVTSDNGDSLTDEGACYSLTATNANPQIGGSGVTCSKNSVINLQSSIGYNCAVLTNGTVRCWGYNLYGQTGKGSTSTEEWTPVTAIGITNATQVDNGYSHSCARLADSTVKCWGYNPSGQVGTGNTTSPQLTPVAVIGITTATQVAVSKSASTYHSCARLTDGTVKCWGYNGSGEVGTGNTTTPQLTPVAVSGITTATQVSAGDSYTCALLSDSTIKCWGRNTYGETGNGNTTTPQLTPVAVTGITTATQISTNGSHACARLSDSSVKCWGYNGSGQVGTGNTTTPQSTPVAVTGITTATAVSAGGSHTCALLADSTIKCWGYNNYGQIGNGNSTTPQLTPVAVSGITTATQVSAGNSHTCARLTDGTVKCWGYNQYGALGNNPIDGILYSQNTPVATVGLPTSGVFTFPVTGLLSGNYSYKAFATNSGGIGYSSAGTFSTGGAPPPATGCTMNTTGDIAISDPCLIPIDGLVYNSTNVIKVMGSDTGTIALAADMTINAGTVVVWGPGKQITRAPGVSLFNSTGSQITQKYICFYDPDSDTVPNDYQLVSQGGTAVLQNTGTCGAGYLRPSSLNATFSSFNTAAYDLAPNDPLCYTATTCQ